MAENKQKVSADSEPKRSATVTIQFKQNRSFELYVNRKMYCFEPHEEKIVEKSVIDHEDFKQVSKYFTIKGAK